MPKVSVIIPVYNVEYHLHKCLDSVIGQTLTDIEIICIEDCSTDSSVEILKEYVSADERITVLYNEENRGLSYSRNRGISVATGEYIQFLDSDDYLDSDALEFLYNTAVDDELDLLRFNFYLDYINLNNEYIIYPNDSNRYSQSACQVNTGQRIFDELVLSCNVNCWCYGCLNFIRTDFLKKQKVLFDDNIIHEDILFLYQLMRIAERCKCVNAYKYHYLQRKGSIVHMKQFKALKSHLIIIREICKDIKNCRSDSQGCISSEIVFLVNLVKQANEYSINIGQNNSEFDDDELDLLYANLISDIPVRRVYSYIDEELLNKIRGKKIYIYGAGVVSKRLITEFDKYNIDIESIIVSSKNNNPSKVYGYGVFLFEETILNGDFCIIVAVSRIYHSEIAERLKEIDNDRIIYLKIR